MIRVIMFKYLLVSIGLTFLAACAGLNVQWVASYKMPVIVQDVTVGGPGAAQALGVFGLDGSLPVPLPKASIPVPVPSNTLTVPVQISVVPSLAASGAK